MTPGGYILLIIVSVCVLALIYIAKKQKELDDLDYYIKRKEKEKKDIIRDSKVLTHPQHIIYEFSAKGTKYVCPFCDGENSAGAKVCNICGRDL